MIMKTQENGKLGESLAREFLEHLGYRFIAANFVRRVGEIDIIMCAPANTVDEEILVFVEVRYRTTDRFGGALGSIDRKKQRKLLRATNAWLQKNACSNQRARIDVITVEPTSAEHCATQTPAISKAEHAGSYLWKQHQLVWVQNAIEELT
jgi:putative endonuclease